MTTPRAVPCKHLRMRPMALANGGGLQHKPLSAAVCDNREADEFGRVLLDSYDAGQWLSLESCRQCPNYHGIRP